MKYEEITSQGDGAVRRDLVHWPLYRRLSRIFRFISGTIWTV